jgi:hypothetical protein
MVAVVAEIVEQQPATRHRAAAAAVAKAGTNMERIVLLRPPQAQRTQAAVEAVAVAAVHRATVRGVAES